MPEASLIGGKIVGLIHELTLHIISIQTLHELEARKLKWVIYDSFVSVSIQTLHELARVINSS